VDEDFDMRQITMASGLVLAFAAGLSAHSAAAQDTKMRNVSDYTCKDVMRETGRNREVAIAFLHGYLLGKSGAQVVDVDAFGKQTNAFIEHCLDHPNDSAAATMLKIKD
jgi:HdeA/HdeB family